MENCIFCKIISGEIPSTTIYEDNDFKVILDVSPATEGHALILPKKHYKDLDELDKSCGEKLLTIASNVGKALMDTFGYEGYNIVQNNGLAAGQTVFHFHMHVIGRKTGGESILTWTPHKKKKKKREELGAKLKETLTK